MSHIILPAEFNNLSLRRDGSVSLRFDTRELTAEEITTLLGFRNTEGWLQFSQNNKFETPPDEAPNLDLKSPSELLRNALYVRYLETKQTSTFQTYYNTKMEQIRQSVLKDIK